MVRKCTNPTSGDLGINVQGVISLKKNSRDCRHCKESEENENEIIILTD